MTIKKGPFHILSWVIFWAYTCLCLYLMYTKAAETKGLDMIVKADNISGITLWITNLYNGDKLLFAIVSTLTMAFVGIILAFITDIFLKMIGLEVTKIKHVE